MDDGSGSDAAPDFAHSTSSEERRREKAITLARYIWDRGISSSELRGLTDEQLRKLARAAEVNPPSTSETWTAVESLIDQKDQWARAHPDHRAAKPQHPDEKIMWIKPSIKPWL